MHNKVFHKLLETPISDAYDSVVYNVKCKDFVASFNSHLLKKKNFLGFSL